MNQTAMPSYNYNGTVHQQQQQQQQRQLPYHQAHQQQQTSPGSFVVLSNYNNNNSNNSVLSQQQHFQQHQQQIQNQQMLYRNQQQLMSSNTSMNGFPPSTSSADALSNVPNGTTQKRAPQKRKNNAVVGDGDTSATASDGAVMRVAPNKKLAFNPGPTPAVVRPTTSAYQQQFIMQQQSPNFCANTSPQMNPAKFGQFMGYESANGSNNFIGNGLTTAMSPPQTQNWSGTNGEVIRRPNSRSEMVRLELRNSVRARQTASITGPAGTSPPSAIASRPPSAHENNQGLYSMLNHPRLHHTQPTNPYHQTKQQSNMSMPTNFIHINANNNNNNLYSSQHMFPEDKTPPQQQYQFYSNGRMFDDCRNAVSVLDAQHFDLSIDIFDFNLLNNNEFDMDNVETQKLVQKLLS